MPDFNNPVEIFRGYPSDVDTELMAELGRTVRLVQAWVTIAYVEQPTVETAAELAAVLKDTSDQLVAYAVRLVR
nr:hypothetical protein [Kibdelosporangium sp. MJ126-NF4]CEL17622.1 hypothetical protein [Kibdelosporangium sp. MJ126-NF4]CTQ91150.1 hypothetical protein [Kibdelosporangium sp. MJ126-NF4]